MEAPVHSFDNNVARAAILRKNAPAALQEVDQFVLWRRELKPTAKDPNHVTKVPYVALATGDLVKAASTRPIEWRGFSAAVGALAKRGDVDGVGFVLNADDPFAGLDLDHCVDQETRVIEDWARVIIDSFASYTEYSPSGTGVRIFFQGRMPDEGKTIQKGRKVYPFKDERAIEAYSNARFLTLTGDRVENTPATVEERQNELMAFHAAHLAKAPPAAARATTHTSAAVSMDDQVLLAKMRKAGGKFAGLYAGGHDGYASPSEARQALLNIIAWWTKDTAQIDRLFRASGCDLSKWDRLGEGEIQNAIDWNGGKGYDPNSARQSGSGKREGKRDANVHIYDEDGREDTSGGDRGGDPSADRGYSPSGKPVIIGKNRQLDDLTREALDHLYTANSAAGPFLFRHNATLARVRRNEMGMPMIEALSKTSLRGIMSEVADFCYIKGEDDLVSMSPPEDMLETILAQPDWRFPALEGLIEAPALRPDGSIITEPGYDAATRLVYIPADGFTMPRVPLEPTPDHVKRAITYIWSIIGEFPYDGEASRAHALALLLTGVVRPAIEGLVPLCLLTAPEAGTGKGLLAAVAPQIASGREAAVFTAPTKEEEWGKQITTYLMAGPAFLQIDNVRGKLDSSKLEAALTAPVWSDRVLGMSRMAMVKQRVVWMATGNNVQLGGDLARRTYRIRLDAQMAHPERRSGFKIDRLPAYVRMHRGTILAALLTIARAWYAAGKPKHPVTPMGSFEDWSETVGSMLAHAGVTGFLTNLDEMAEETNTDRPQWLAFLSAWRDEYAATPKTAGEVANAIYSAAREGYNASVPFPLGETLPEDLQPHVKDLGMLQKRLGYALRDRADRRYELDTGEQVYIKNAGVNRVKTTTWQVVMAHPAPRTTRSTEHNSQNGKTSPASKDGDSSSFKAPVQEIAGDVRTYAGEKSVEDSVSGICDTDISTGASAQHLLPSPAGMPETVNSSDFEMQEMIGQNGDRNTSPINIGECEHPLRAIRTLKTGATCGMCGKKVTSADLMKRDTVTPQDRASQNGHKHA